VIRASQQEMASLIPETSEEMEHDEELKEVERKLKEVGQKQLTREERRQHQRSLDNLDVPNFGVTLKLAASPSKRRR